MEKQKFSKKMTKKTHLFWKLRKKAYLCTPIRKDGNDKFIEKTVMKYKKASTDKQ